MNYLLVLAQLGAVAVHANKNEAKCRLIANYAKLAAISYFVYITKLQIFVLKLKI